MRYFVTVGDRTLEVEVGPEGVVVGGRTLAADLQPVPGTPVRSLILDGASHRLAARREGHGRWEIHLGGRRIPVRVLDERRHTILLMTGGGAAPAGPRPVRAPMPGLVVRVEVREGDLVEPGRGLVIVEAMKMENELRADVAGRIMRVHARAGETVEKDQVLIEFEPPDAPSAEPATGGQRGPGDPGT